MHWHCLKCGSTSRDPGKASKRLDNVKNGALGKKGGTRSCGCKQSKLFVNANTRGLIQEDLSNSVINGLEVISKTDIQDSNRSYYYKVKCPYCGRIFPLSGRHLKDGYCASSCGCVRNTQYGLIGEGFGQYKAKSADEQFIMDMLDSIYIPYQKEKQFIDLVNPKTNGFLSYDFYLESPRYGKYLIEFDGEQHFKETHNWGMTLKERHELDLLKNRYAWSNNMRLIRIPWNAEYQLNDLSIADTRFELTPQNEEEYYNSRMAS